MADILNLNFESIRKDSILQGENLIISIPLSNKVFRKIYLDEEDKELAEKKLKYIAYVSSYKSPGNIKGLSNRELHNEAIVNIGIDKSWQPDESIDRGIKEYKKLYSRGIYGTIIELRRSYENVRRSISLLSRVLDNELEKIELAQDISEEELAKKVKSLVSSSNDLKSLTSNLQEDVDNLKKAESALKIEEKKHKLARAGTMVSNSAKVN